MHKKRGYNREIPKELERDYKLFAIACEGRIREPEYFDVFRYFSNKIAVDIIEDKVSDEEVAKINPNKSAPKWVLDRAMRYIEKEGLNEEDELWFVMDVDRWEEKQLREIAHFCDTQDNWHIVLSNPCFEVWLYFHKKSNIAISQSNSCKDFKKEISKFEKGGYHPLKFISQIKFAIDNAKNTDTNKDYFFPETKKTKVYELAESIINKVGENDFATFCKKTLPSLIKDKSSL